LVQEQVLTQTQVLTRIDPVVEVIRDFERFKSIGPEWDRLVDRWGLDRVFLSHTWFCTWWEAFGAGKELHIVTVRHGGHLVAAAPMMRSRTGMYGFNVDRIESIYNPHTPRYDFIVGNYQDADLYRMIWDELRERSGCDLVVLTQIPNGSNTMPSLEMLGQQSGWLTGQWIAPSSPFISLREGYEAFLNSLRDGSRYNLAKRYARLSKLGTIEIEIVKDPKAVPEALKDGLRIEAAAWKGREGTAIVSDSAVAEFYVRLAEREADLGRLRLAFLVVGGKRIAFSYLLQSKNKLYAVKIGYDPEYHAFSPGNMLLNLVLKHACAEGIDEYDFLGVDDEWKYEWTKQERKHRWLFLFRNRPRLRLLHYLKFSLAPAVKPYLPRKG
jgi:CelD/BcsL family acetyltransferase involved in cellulose biosynthesis